MTQMITGISLDTKIAKKAKAIAKKARRTFSNYVEGLLIADQKRLINKDNNQKKPTKLKRR